MFSKHRTTPATGTIHAPLDTKMKSSAGKNKHNIASATSGIKLEQLKTIVIAQLREIKDLTSQISAEEAKGFAIRQELAKIKGTTPPQDSNSLNDKNLNITTKLRQKIPPGATVELLDSMNKIHFNKINELQQLLQKLRSQNGDLEKELLQARNKSQSPQVEKKDEKSRSRQKLQNKKEAAVKARDQEAQLESSEPQNESQKDNVQNLPPLPNKIARNQEDQQKDTSEQVQHDEPKEQNRIGENARSPQTSMQSQFQSVEDQKDKDASQPTPAQQEPYETDLSRRALAINDVPQEASQLNQQEEQDQIIQETDTQQDEAPTAKQAARAIYSQVVKESNPRSAQQQHKLTEAVSGKTTIPTELNKQTTITNHGSGLIEVNGYKTTEFYREFLEDITPNVISHPESKKTSYSLPSKYEVFQDDEDSALVLLQAVSNQRAQKRERRLDHRKLRENRGRLTREERYIREQRLQQESKLTREHDLRSQKRLRVSLPPEPEDELVEENQTESPKQPAAEDAKIKQSTTAKNRQIPNKLIDDQKEELRIRMQNSDEAKRIREERKLLRENQVDVDLIYPDMANLFPESQTEKESWHTQQKSAQSQRIHPQDRTSQKQQSQLISFISQQQPQIQAYLQSIQQSSQQWIEPLLTTFKQRLQELDIQSKHAFWNKEVILQGDSRWWTKADCNAKKEQLDNFIRSWNLDSQRTEGPEASSIITEAESKRRQKRELSEEEKKEREKRAAKFKSTRKAQRILALRKAFRSDIVDIDEVYPSIANLFPEIQNEAEPKAAAQMKSKPTSTSQKQQSATEKPATATPQHQGKKPEEQTSKISQVKTDKTINKQSVPPLPEKLVTGKAESIKNREKKGSAK